MVDDYVAVKHGRKQAEYSHDVLKDVLEPVSTILYKRAASYDVQVVCPMNMVVMTDAIRLKQVRYLPPNATLE